MRESPVQASIKSFLEYQKCLVFRMNSGKVQDARSMAWIQLQRAGTPDLLVGIPQNGQYVMAWIETKRSSGGKLNDDQVRELRWIHGLGIPWLVADSYEDVQEWWSDIRYHGKEKYVRDVLTTSDRFVPSKKAAHKQQKMSTSLILEHERWMRENGR